MATFNMHSQENTTETIEFTEQENRIEDLEKKRKNQAFENISQLGELQKQLLIEKTTIEELRLKLTEAAESLKTLLDLESKLSEAETQLLSLRELEIGLRKEISSLKAENLALKTETDELKFSKTSRKSANFRKPEVVFPASVDRIAELQAELEKRDLLITQIKETCLDTVLEKERMIYELQAKAMEGDKEELHKIIENLEKKVGVITEELERAQLALGLEREKNEKEVSVHFSRNFQVLMAGKAKETENLLEQIREQDEKELELSRRVVELETALKKTIEEKNGFASKFEAFKAENVGLRVKVCELETTVLWKEKQLGSLTSALSEETAKFEREKANLLLDAQLMNEKVEVMKAEAKKMTQGLNEQNTQLREKNDELREAIEQNQQRHEKELKELREKFDDQHEKLKNQQKFSSPQRPTTRVVGPVIAHKKTLSQELRSFSKDHAFFSFMESPLRSPRPTADTKTDTKIRFSVSMPQEENLISHIQKQRKSILQQSPGIGEVITLHEVSNRNPRKEEERLSTVQDNMSQSEIPNKLISAQSSSEESEESEDEKNDELMLEIRELEGEIERLKAENNGLKAEIHQTNEKFIKERECFQKRENSIITDLQRSRRESLFPTVSDSAMKNLQSEVSGLESMMRVIEEQIKEERKFWESEMKEVERKAIDAKMKYAQAMGERDALELRLKQIQLGRGQTKSEGKNGVKSKSFFDFLFCND